MPDYRLYELSIDGQGEPEPLEFFATSDAAALAHARLHPCGHGCEVWAGTRFVGAVAPVEADRGPRATLRRLLQRWRDPQADVAAS